MRIGIEAQRIFRSNPHGMDVFAINLINHLVLETEVEKVVVFINAPELRRGVLIDHSKLEIVLFEAQYMLWEQSKLANAIAPYALDLMHFTSNTAAINFPIPVIATLHDAIFLEKHPLFVPGYTPYQRFGNWYRRIVVRQMFRKKVKLVTVSQSEADEIKSRFNIENIGMVYNGVAPMFKHEEHDAVAPLLNALDITAPYVLFLGNRDPKKNTRRVLEMFAHVARERDDLVFVILDLAKEELPKLSLEDQKILLPKIRTLGYVPQKEMPKLYSGASAFVYCSNRESFGIPMIEAYKCEVPVLASAIPALTEVSAGGAKLVNPASIEEMKMGLIELLDNQSLRAELVEKGKNIAEKYSWAKSARNYIAHYKELL